MDNNIYHSQLDTTVNVRMDEIRREAEKPAQSHAVAIYQQGVLHRMMTAFRHRLARLGGRVTHKNTSINEVARSLEE